MKKEFNIFYSHFRWDPENLRFSDKSQKAIDLLRVKCLKLRCMVLRWVLWWYLIIRIIGRSLEMKNLPENTENRISFQRRKILRNGQSQFRACWSSDGCSHNHVLSRLGLSSIEELWRFSFQLNWPFSIDIRTSWWCDNGHETWDFCSSAILFKS